MRVKLSNSPKYLLVDDEDYNKISKYSWRLTNNGYVVNNKGHLCHRILLNTDDIIHHINHDKLDNRRVNLEEMNYKQHNNIHKCRSGKFISKYPGATYIAKKQNPWTRVWQSAIRYNTKLKSLGYFEDPLTASIVFKIVSRELAK